METKNKDNVKTLYWSMSPGNFVNIDTGAITSNHAKQKFIFEGTVRMWFETFIEMIETAVGFYDISKNQRGIEISCSPEVLNIIEHCISYHSYDKNRSYDKKIALNNADLVGVIAGIGKVSVNNTMPYNQCNVYLLDADDENATIIDRVQIKVLDMPVV